jgi:GcrA cell cycle regulator
MGRSTWSPEQDEQLRRLWEEELSTILIGKAMGITKNAVIGRAHRLHLSLRHKPPGSNPTKRKHVKKAKSQPRDKTVRRRVPKNTIPLTPLPPPVPPRTPVRPVVVNNGPLSIMEVGSVHCRAIIGEVDAERTMMCAKPVFSDARGARTSYCEMHSRAFLTGLSR